ncbi:hypothetical protein CSHISOI_11768 [Colletotrichum shisoi]|uniref:Uncharacterized protein n=1 Tax=Colletotrichum shisoi TaxID=2078593 RepID=A0A5Q4B9V2_9PEZI|nr:hypothetical protein CSHISOI_11768 [Colletotrichum shisoi]
MPSRAEAVCRGSG